MLRDSRAESFRDSCAYKLAIDHHCFFSRGLKGPRCQSLSDRSLCVHGKKRARERCLSISTIASNGLRKNLEICIKRFRIDSDVVDRPSLHSFIPEKPGSSNNWGRGRTPQFPRIVWLYVRIADIDDMAGDLWKFVESSEWNSPRFPFQISHLEKPSERVGMTFRNSFESNPVSDGSISVYARIITCRSYSAPHAGEASRRLARRCQFRAAPVYF